MTDKPRGFKARLKHAFAVEKKEAVQVDEKTEETINRICREVVRRQMVVPALMLLEMSRPLNYLGSQALHFFQPFASVLVDSSAWGRFAAFLEQRGSVEFMIQRLEDLNAENAPSEPSEGEEGAASDAESGVDDRPGGGESDEKGP